MEGGPGEGRWGKEGKERWRGEKGEKGGSTKRGGEKRRKVPTLGIEPIVF